MFRRLARGLTRCVLPALGAGTHGPWATRAESAPAAPVSAGGPAAARPVAAPAGGRRGAPPALTPWALALVLPLTVLAFSQIDVVDDAYISYRYALHLARGHGLVFNPGEPVEGVTNLLWTVLVAAPLAAGVPVHVAAVTVGVAFGMLAMVDTWRVCRCLGVSPWAAGAALLVLGLYPRFWLTVANGLEGGLFSFLLLRTVYTLIRPGRPDLAGLWGGLLFLTRPDSLLVVPLGALYRQVAPAAGALAVAPARPGAPGQRAGGRGVLAVLLPWAALVGGVTLWRWLSYGAWLPNTFTAKSVPLGRLDAVLENARMGLRYWVRFLLFSPPLTLGALLAVLRSPRLPAVWLCLAVVGVQVPVILLNGGDWMPHHRLLAVYAPLLAVLLGVGIQGLATFRRGIGPLPPAAVPGGVGLLLGAGLGLVLGTNTSGAWRVRASPRLEVPTTAVFTCHELLATRLRPVTLPTDRISPEALGIFSYVLADVYAHDLLGLTDAYVARHGDVYYPMSGKSNLAYTYARVRPTLFVLHEADITVAALQRASGGRYVDEYATYAVVGHPTCYAGAGPPLVLGIRNDAVARLVPPLEALGLERLDPLAHRSPVVYPRPVAIGPPAAPGPHGASAGSP